MIAEKLRKSKLLSGFKSMAQIKRKKSRGLVITRICGSIILAIATCVVLASFAGFDHSKVPSFNLFREMPPRDVGENPTPGHLWQGDQTSLNFTVAAMLTMGNRLPATYVRNGRNTHTSHPLSLNAKFFDITPSSIVGGAGITPTTADVCICLFIDIPPPCPKA